MWSLRLLVLVSAVICTYGNSSESSEYDIDPRVSGTTCKCGWTNKGRIIGGQQAQKNSYPWIVALTDGRSNFCGGTIVTPYHILTAGHCVEGRGTYNTKIMVGAHDMALKDGVTMELRAIHLHRGYGSSQGLPVNDIAVLETAQPISFTQNVGPACMPVARIPLDGRKIKAIGWGMTVFGGQGSRLLQEVDLSVLPFSECQRGWGWKLPQVQSQICTHDIGKSTCHGDSGGPLVYLDPATGRYTLVALTSFGNKCQTPPPAMNTEIAAFLPWINGIISSSRPGSKTCTRV